MNPPPSEDDDEPTYRGSEALDVALADRFAFVLQMPAWDSFAESDQEQVILATDTPVDPAAAGRLRGILDNARLLLPAVRDEYGRQLATYVRLVTGLLARGGLVCSPRRTGMLLRNIAAVHTARYLLTDETDLAGSAFIALTSSLPQRATGHTVKAIQLLAAHREAWNMAGLEADDPRRLILAEVDPLRRAMRATRVVELSREDFSGLIADALASLRPGARHALAVELFDSGAAGRLVAAVAEQCASLYTLVAAAQSVHESVPSRGARHATWQAVVAALARLPADGPDTTLATNLLAGLFGRGELGSEHEVTQVLHEWQTARTRLEQGRR